LLTGSTPLERKRLKAAAILEVLRLIREEEPPRPSTRLSTTDEMPRVAANRGLEPKKLSGVVRGELDWIVMKALDKDRNRRYETANGFAMDVQRYLADEPVAAGPPSAWYRFRKFVRRNRTGLTVAGLVVFFVASLVGLGGWAVRDRAARQARVANQLELALDRAELFQGQGKPAEALAAFNSAELLAAQAPADPARNARLADLKERLDATARDQEFVAGFEHIRLRVEGQVDVRENSFTSMAAYHEIRGAFGHYGIEIGVVPPAEAAARIRGRPGPVCRDLVAALYECLRTGPRGDAQVRQWLHAVLDGADADPWRQQVRKALADRNPLVLEQLAREADVQTQPPSFLLFVAHSLPTSMRPTRLNLFRRIQGAHPADLWANQALGDDLYENGKPAEAVRYLTAALALRPDNPGLYLNLGDALKNAGELGAAITAYQRSIALAPRYGAGHFAIAVCLEDEGRLKDAIAGYREALRINENDFDARSRLSLALKADGRHEDAIAEFHRIIADCSKVIERDPENALAWSALGNCYFVLGQYDTAVAHCSRAIELNSELWAPRSKRGLAYLNLGQPQKALTDFSRAIDLAPRYAHLWCNRGLAYSRLGQYEKAVEDGSRALEIDRKCREAWCNRSLAHSYLGQYEKAAADAEKAIELYPNYADAHNDLAWLLATCPDAKLRDSGRAVELARKAVQLAPNDENFWGTLGAAQYRAGDWKAAVTALEKSQALKPGWDAYDWLFLAMAHRKLGNAPESRMAYDRAIEWLEKNKALLEKKKKRAEELRRFRSEAEEVLELKN
jgi:tetratricopeptide (TPR) repeat protein